MRIRASLVWASCVLSLGLFSCGSSDDSAGANSAGQGGSGLPSAGAGGTKAGGSGGTAQAGSAGSSLGGTMSTGGGSGGVSASASGSGATAGAGGSSAGGTNAGGVSGGGGASGSSAQAGASGSAGAGGAGGALPFALTSPAFTATPGCSKDNVPACDQFPTEMLLTTIGGANHSPELDWTAGPAGTLSYALVLHDDSNDYTHWAVWNIPANARKLPASLANGSSPNGLTGVKQVSFFDSGTGYAGPGAHAHVYQFKLYALKVATLSPTLPGTNPQTAVRTVLESSSDVIATTDLRGASAP